MSADYTLILRSCPEAHRESAAVFIGKLFSLKEHTCQQIVQSCPIVLMTGLGREEAAAMHLLVHSMAASGTIVELSGQPLGDLPKIDWPRRPQVFKRELSEWVADLQVSLALPGGGNARLLDLLLAAVDGKPPTKNEFKGTQLPEVTPFSTAALPPVESRPATTRTPAGGVQRHTPPAPMPTPAPASGEDPMARLNELFPEEEGGGFMPGKDDITSILNKILPDEQPAGGSGSGSGGSRQIGSGGYSVFLAKIADEDRRKKAVVLIAEIGKVPADEAETLSKKMIIPVLKGATKEDAEAAKAQFGKIGILARVKGPE